jgi:crotonobetainyl-CoA:carnitine CoA-transferase CaiB-like acyl-CoA transferase
MYGGTSPKRTGARHAAIAPYGPFTCGDGNRVFLGIQNEREWATFCDRILASPELAADPRFVRNSGRVEHNAELRDAIEAVFAAQSAEAVAEQLEQAGIANALLRTMDGLAAHPQLASRERWRTYHSPAGELRALLPPVTMSDSTPVMGPIPEVGQHTDAVLAEFGIRAPITAATGA